MDTGFAIAGLYSSVAQFTGLYLTYSPDTGEVRLASDDVLVVVALPDRCAARASHSVNSLGYNGLEPGNHGAN